MWFGFDRGGVVAQAVQAVRQYLEESGGQFRIDDERGVAFWRLWGTKTCYASTLRFYQGQDLVVLTLRFCHLVPPIARKAVLRLLTRINHGLSMGTFEMSLDDGEIRLRMDLDHEGKEVSPLSIRRLVQNATRLGDRYAYSLFRVIYGQDDLEALSLFDSAEEQS